MGTFANVTLAHPQGVLLQLPGDVGKGRTLALHRGQLGAIHRMSFQGYVPSTPFRRSFAEWEDATVVLDPCDIL